MEQDPFESTNPSLVVDGNNDSDEQEEEEQDQEEQDDRDMQDKCNEDDKLQLIESNLLLQDKMEGGLLDNLDIVQRAALLISHMQKNQKNNEKTAELSEILSPTDLSVSSHNQPKVNNGSNNNDHEEESEDCTRGQSQIANLKLLMSEIIENKDCADCGTKFDSSLKLKMHIFQEHGHSVMRYPNEEGGTLLSSSDSELMNKLQLASNHHQQHQQPMLGKPEDWMSLAAGLSFSFPADASSYQLPMLGMSSQVQMGSFGGGGGSNLDALSRPGPPLRIFNPEAYCDLCNKEFCNKYFLKTHRANKHGIYEHSSNASDSSASNPATVPPPVNVSNSAPPSSISSLQPASSAASTAHLIQQQQQQQQLCNPESTQQQQTQSVNGNLTPCDSGTVNCDICMKKFANTFAMKRHRTKAHEAPASADKSDQNPMLNQGLEGERSNPLIRFPDDFRPDFSVEQEDASFTPQPRKLSPVSSQQARESNFSVDKLKRLGVLNPEAFCELCCKEYCNKYFLRTHKLKRHGILMPPDEVKDVTMQQFADRNPWQFLQANPLNLMLGEFNPIQQLQQKFLSEMTELANRKPNAKSPAQVVKQEVDGKAEGEMHIGSRDDSPSLLSPVKKQHVDNSNKRSDGTSAESPSEQQQVDVDAISMDLQKLQSMILQLNDLNANHQAQQIIPCHLCGKELDNQYLFHAHLMAEHGHMPENAALSATKSASVSPVGLGQQQLHAEFCKQCDKDFPNAGEFKQHLFEVHGIVQRPGSVSPTREGFVTPDRPTATANLNSGSSTSMPATPTGERRPPYTMTPTSSYCEICNKELCNKYFMKTHMQRMHGIEIENGSQIGGVVCNICNKELCSKYFLRVHKHNTHGIVEDGAPLPPQIAAKVNGEAAAAAAAAAAASAGTSSASSASGQGNGQEVNEGEDESRV